ncbi:MAG: hypothetical protein RLZZ292_3196 [Bacteroidota bacterium]|jgi:hypothetical protein
MKTFISILSLSFFTFFSASAHVVAIVKQGLALSLSGNKNTISAAMFDAGSYLDDQSVACGTPLIFSFDAARTLLTVDLGQAIGLNCVRIYVTNPCNLKDQAYVETYLDQQLSITSGVAFPTVENIAPFAPDECKVFLSASINPLICNPVAIARQGIAVSPGSSSGKGLSIPASAFNNGSYGNCGQNISGIGATFDTNKVPTTCSNTLLPPIKCCCKGLKKVRLIACSNPNINYADTYLDYQDGAGFCGDSTSCAPTVIAMQGIAVKMPPSNSVKIFPKHLDAGSFVPTGCGAITKFGISLTDNDLEHSSLTFESVGFQPVRLYATNLLNGKPITNWVDTYIQIQAPNIVPTEEIAQNDFLSIYLSDNQLILSGDSELKIVSVVNTLGQTVLFSNTSSKPLNCANLSTGIYYVHIVKEQGKMQVAKFFKP